MSSSHIVNPIKLHKKGNKPLVLAHRGLVTAVSGKYIVCC